MSSTTNKLGPPWTVLKLLDWSRGFFAEQGIESSRLDAELLLSHVLGLDRVQLYMEYDRPLVPDELSAYRALVKRRAHREPVAYLTNTRGFWSLDLKCDERALVPRPDTEVLVEEALERLAEGAVARVLDVGTGTGAIALSIKAERPTTEVVASDVDTKALALARENADALELELELIESDLLSNVSGEFDLIVSNPPYVATDADVDAEVRHEPAHALFAGADGLDVIRRLVEVAPNQLKPSGWLLCEHGFDQGEAVRSLFESAGYTDVFTRKDYGGNDRVTGGKRP